MAARRSKEKRGSSGNTPIEIPMTDLGWSEDGEEINEEPWRDSHAAGTPGGGTASGGLAGSNSGRGDPDDLDLEGALGSGVLDTGGDDKGGAPYAGDSGGAVGGTPAEKRVQGGRKHGGLSPGGPHRGDSTIGSQPTERDG